MDMVSKDIKWAEIMKQIPGRTAEQIRSRYVNALDPSLIKTPWTKEEDEILFKYQRKLGNKWTVIKKFLPGRSENSIKNRFNNRTKSELIKKKKEQKRKAKHANSVSNTTANSSPPRIEVTSVMEV